MNDAGKILRKGLLIVMALGLLVMGCSAGGTALNKENDGGLAKLNGIDVVDSADATTVVVDLDKQVTYTSVKLTDPPMMVVDLAGVDLGDNTTSIKYEKGQVTYVTPSRDAVAKRIARLEIGLSSPASSVITQDGSRISISFEKPVEAPSSVPPEQAASEAQSAEEPVSMTAVEAVEEDTGVISADTSVPEKTLPEPVEGIVADATTVNGISLADSDGVLNVKVEGDGRFQQPTVFMLGSDRLVVDMPGLGSDKEKDTIEIGGKLVRRVRMARHDGPDGKVRMVLDLGSEVSYDVRPVGNSLMVYVTPAGGKVEVSPVPAAVVNPAPVAAAKLPAVVQSAPVEKVETKMTAGRKITVSAPPAVDKSDESARIFVTQKDGKTILSSSPSDDTSGMTKVEKKDKYVVTETKVYTGGKISFDIQDAELDKVIKLLADVAGLNLIMNPSDVKGTVTLKLANVPWDQALDILLKIYNLDKVLEGNVLRVAPKAKLDAERNTDLKAISEQKRLKEEAEDLYTKTFKINYSDATELEPQVKKTLSKRGDATAIPRTNELIIRDVRDKIDEAAALIEILDKEVNQIMIEARIVTMDTGYSQTLGVSWGLTRSDSDPNFGVSSGQSPREITMGAGTDGNAGTFALNGLPALAAVAGGLTGGMSFGILQNINLDLTIQALEVINKAETLSAPKVLTLENKAATITQGTTLYVQTTTATGTAPTPLNANLSLTVTPKVTGDNFIIMDVNATKNQPSTSVPAGSTASIDTNAVTTNVIVKDGETIVLGGIYTKSNTKNESRVPLLGRIPILGWLFKNKVYDEPQQELLIFITPKIVKQPKLAVKA